MSFAVINNFLHLLAAVIWIGGMIFANMILFPSHFAIDPPQRGKLLGAVVKRFTIVSWICIVVLVLTGLYKTPTHMLLSPEGNFGLWLTIKHIVIILLILFGIIITFVIGPKIRKLGPQQGEQPSAEFLNAQKQIRILGTTNMILGIIVLFCVSMMQNS